MYQPGLHIIATLSATDSILLNTYEGLQQVVNDLVKKYALVKLGEIYHQFSPVGFTAAVCLSESHISLHTWPEYLKVNLDIYLSNFLRYNNETVQEIFETFVAYFEATTTDIHKINR